MPDFLNPGLLVQSGNLSLVGGNLILNGARITALRGGLNLAALAAPGTVDLIPVGNAFQLKLPQNMARADISISNGSILSLAAAAPLPSITIQSRNLEVSQRSSLLSFLSSFVPRGFHVGDVAIDTTGEMTVNDSSVFTGSTNDARGIAGNLNITTARLLVTGAARIGTTNLGPSTPGATNITADTITVDGTGSRLLEGTATGIYSTNYSNLTTPTSEIRNSGNINIRTRSLSVLNGGFISASTFAPGNGGDVNINATGTILIEGITPGITGVASLIGSTVEEDGIGNGGNVNITAPTLVLNQGGGVAGRVRGGSQGNGGNINLNLGTLEARNGGAVVATSQGTGNAGNINLNVRDRILLTGRDSDYERRTAIFGSFSSLGEAASGIYANLASGGTGTGGSIQIRTGELSLQDGAQISASTSGTGSAGNLEIRDTRLVEVAGTSSFDGRATSINAEVRTGSTGNGGNLSIATQQLRLTDGGQVSASTQGQGNAGNIQVNTNTIDLNGVSSNGQIPSRLTTSTTTNGSSGTIAIETTNLQLQNGAQIITGTASSGNAGNLTVTARGSIDISGQSNNRQFRSGLFTTVEPGATGQGGNLTVIADRLQVAGGLIQTGTAGSGNSGNLLVRANQIELSNRGFTFQPSGNATSDSITLGNTATGGGLSTATLPQATGRGGNVTVEGDRLRITEGGQITADTFGAGHAGNAIIRVDNIEIQGTGVSPTVGGIPPNLLNPALGNRTTGNRTTGNNGTPSIPALTGIFTTAVPGSSGNGGQLTVVSDRLNLLNSGALLHESKKVRLGLEVTSH